MPSRFPPVRQPKRGHPTVEITRREEFSAAHRLHNPELSEEENRRVYGICNNLHGHGHNYALEVTVRGVVPDANGMVMNLNDLLDLAVSSSPSALSPLGFSLFLATSFLQRWASD